MTPKYTRRPRTDYIVVHCADTDPSWHGSVDIDTVRQWHTSPPRNWIDVGYHLYIPRSGVIQLGRPLWSQGAHVRGYNDESLGICLEGGTRVVTDGKGNLVRKEEDYNFTEKQETALRALLASMKIAYPDARIVGHRDLDPGKYCPSFDAESWWEIHRPAELL